MTNQISIPVSDVVFRKDLYPRIETSAITVQQYAEDLDVLPAIEINQHNELIDGWHRWMAHRKAGAASIKALVTQTANESEFLELAIVRNAAFGLRLSQDDKRDMARRIYHTTPERERDRKKKELARILSVSERTVREWLSRIDKDSKAQRDKLIFERWLACQTQEEIAAEVELSRSEIAKTVPNGNFSEWNKTDQQHAVANHVTDFDPPLYNVWKRQEKTPGASHPGNSDVAFVDNLLYLYTQPFDMVVDPFAGGGSTIDICRKRYRRYWASDRKPIPERAHQIRQHDLTAGLPPMPRWQDVALVYLDPPYWKQMENQYSQDPQDLANMPLDQFTTTLAGIINGFAKKLKTGATIALMLQPTQWRAPDRQYTDHVADMIKAVKLPIDMRVQCPYESQQCTPQMVDWAKENRKLLVLSRELVIWRIP